MRETEGKTILVVEDEMDVQLYLQTVLDNAGFQVMVASNGKQALDRIKDRTPDLISLDLEMPHMRGVKLLEYLQKNKEWARIPFIIVTSHARDGIGKKDIEELHAKGIVVGPHSFLEKPIVPSEYVSRIRNALMPQGGTEGIQEEETAEALRERLISALADASKDQMERILQLLETWPS